MTLHCGSLYWVLSGLQETAGTKDFSVPLFLDITLEAEPRLTERPWCFQNKFNDNVQRKKKEYWSGLPFSSLGDLPDPYFTLQCQGCIARTDTIWLASLKYLPSALAPSTAVLLEYIWREKLSAGLSELVTSEVTVHNRTFAGNGKSTVISVATDRLLPSPSHLFSQDHSFFLIVIFK